MEEDVAWLLQKGVVRVVDKIVDSVEFSLSVRRITTTCMVVRVEDGKQVIREQVSSGKFIPIESNALLEHTQVMHAKVKSFLETKFSSYPRLGELDMEGLRQLCGDLDVKERCLEDIISRFGPSSTPSSM